VRYLEGAKMGSGNEWKLPRRRKVGRLVFFATVFADNSSEIPKENPKEHCSPSWSVENDKTKGH
jgi:hypothetical protein